MRAIQGGPAEPWQALLACAAVLAGTAAASPPAPHQAKQKSGPGRGIVITLKNDFIEKYKDRVTLEADFRVDEIGPIHKVKSKGLDGDMHFSGRSEEIGLPVVAEIMNAKFQKQAVKAVRAAQGKDPVKIAGAWRLWCEHANSTPQIQGAALQPFEDSNPDHVFEIHPVTRFGKVDTLDSAEWIDGYQYYDAAVAFPHYANVTCKIKPNGDGTTTIRTFQAGYNYVEFILESLETPDQKKGTEDGGRLLRANVRDTDGELVARDVRMAFIEDTNAERAARKLPKNGRLHVAAIPRIDLALVSWRVKHKDDPQFQGDSPLEWNLPYEMIIVGVQRD